MDPKNKKRILMIVIIVLIIVAALAVPAIIYAPSLFASVSPAATLTASNFSNTGTPAKTAEATLPKYTQISPASKASNPPTDAELEEYNRLLSGTEIGTADISVFNKITSDMTVFEILKILGVTKRFNSIIGNTAYYIADGDKISFYTITTDRFVYDKSTKPFENILSFMGTEYAKTAAGQPPFDFAEEAKIKEMLLKGDILESLFTRSPLATETTTGSGIEIDGTAGYHKVKSGQKYSSVEQLESDLKQVFTQEKVDFYLSKKTYAMKDGSMYALLVHGQMRTYFNPLSLYVKEMNASDRSMILSGPVGTDNGFDVMQREVILTDEGWRIK